MGCRTGTPPWMGAARPSSCTRCYRSRTLAAKAPTRCAGMQLVFAHVATRVGNRAPGLWGARHRGSAAGNARWCCCCQHSRSSWELLGAAGLCSIQQLSVVAVVCAANGTLRSAHLCLHSAFAGSIATNSVPSVIPRLSKQAQHQASAPPWSLSGQLCCQHPYVLPPLCWCVLQFAGQSYPGPHPAGPRPPPGAPLVPPGPYTQGAQQYGGPYHAGNFEALLLQAYTS